MSRAEVQSAFEKHRPDLLWSATFISNPRREAGYACFPLGSGTCLIIKYGSLEDQFRNPGPESTVEGIELTHFADLRREIPKDLFDAVLMIHSARFVDDFDPVSLIRAVNTLLPLGKEKALLALRTYYSVATKIDRLQRQPHRRFRYDLDEQRIFLVGRLLFVRKDGSPLMPWMAIGAPSSPVFVKKDDPNWPLFPLVVESGIPFSLSGGYAIGGYPQSPLGHLEFFDAHCVLRDGPLVPEGSPIAAVEAITRSRNWTNRIQSLGEQVHHPEALLRDQAVKCIWHLCEDIPTDVFWKVGPNDAGAQNWARIVELVKQKNIEWDEAKRNYVLQQ
jgi:hypothetical protein